MSAWIAAKDGIARHYIPDLPESPHQAAIALPKEEQPAPKRRRTRKNNG